MQDTCKESSSPVQVIYFIVNVALLTEINTNFLQKKYL